MNFAFFTYGLTPINIRLMPWRYVLEVARCTAEAGHKVLVLSDSPQNNKFYPPSFPEIVQIAGSFSNRNKNFRSYIGDFKPDAVFFPVARRSVLSGKFVKANGAAHFAYFPSAWYHKRLLLNNWRKLSALDAIYYGLESVIPGRWLTNVLYKRDIHGVIALSNYTGRMFIKNGWPQQKLKVVFPGLEIQGLDPQPSAIFNDYSKLLSGKKYFLFMGPPKAIRGIYDLLKAFDVAVPQIEDVKLVCLIRGGTEDELATLECTLNGLRHKGSVITIKDNLNKADIEAFIAGCYAVVLPFLLIPSEIPLTILEVLALGKPIIISETGGTSEYVGDAGMAYPASDTEALKNALIIACNDKQFYSMICQAAQDRGKRQPSWPEVTDEFLKFVVPIIENCK